VQIEEGRGAENLLLNTRYEVHHTSDVAFIKRGLAD